MRVNRPPAIRSMLAAILATTAGLRKPGRIAAMISSRSVVAASAAAVDQASSTGSAGPLMSFRFSSATSVVEKPNSSARRATRRQ